MMFITTRDDSNHPKNFEVDAYLNIWIRPLFRTRTCYACII